MTGDVVERVKSHKFYFMEPEPRASMDRLVDLLMELRPIQSISILYCDGGFLVRLGFFIEREPKDVLQYIRKKVTSEYGYILQSRPASV